LYWSDIQDISHKFDFVAKHGSEKEIFRFMKTLETGLSSDGFVSMVTDPMVSIMDSLNTSCGKVSDEMSFSKSSDFRDKPVSSVFIKRKQSKYRTIKPAIQSKFEFDSKITFTCKHDFYITGIGVTRNDHLLLCNRKSTDVMVLSDDSKQALCL
jgi:hypothetical protein